MRGVQRLLRSVAGQGQFSALDRQRERSAISLSRASSAASTSDYALRCELKGEAVPTPADIMAFCRIHDLNSSN
jgi:hypothetical protein